MKNNILLIIAARGGSKGVKNKNIKPLMGKPLIVHTIAQALKWGKADKIICSTDSEKIAACAIKYGALVPFRRPLRLAQDNSPKLSVLRHALAAAEKYWGKSYNVIVDLDATAPIRTVADIDNAYKLLIKKDLDTVFSVTKARKNPYFNIVEINPEGFAILSKKLKNTCVRRQDAPIVYDMNASIYIYRREFLLDPRNLSPISKKSMVWIMDELSAFDIDTNNDFMYVDFLIKKGLVKLL